MSELWTVNCELNFLLSANCCCSLKFGWKWIEFQPPYGLTSGSTLHNRAIYTELSHWTLYDWVTVTVTVTVTVKLRLTVGRSVNVSCGPAPPARSWPDLLWLSVRPTTTVQICLSYIFTNLRIYTGSLRWHTCSLCTVHTRHVVSQSTPYCTAVPVPAVQVTWTAY